MKEENNEICEDPHEAFYESGVFQAVWWHQWEMKSDDKRCDEKVSTKSFELCNYLVKTFFVYDSKDCHGIDESKWIKAVVKEIERNNVWVYYSETIVPTFVLISWKIIDTTKSGVGGTRHRWKKKQINEKINK